MFTNAGDLVGFTSLIGILLIMLYFAFRWAIQKQKEEEALKEIRDEFSTRTHHSPKISSSWSVDDVPVSASATTSFSASASPSEEPGENEEWTGSSGTVLVRTAEDEFTGISGSGYVPRPKDEKCQWCGHRYQLVINGIEYYYCPRCGGPRR